jgi:hypothetical protein
MTATPARARRDADLAFSDEVQHEDLGICEDVQRGFASGSYVPGRLNPLRETGVHHFHELLRAAYRDATRSRDALLPPLLAGLRHRGTPHDLAPPASATARLRAAGKPLGLWMATALVVGSMIGSGVFMLPAALAPYGAASLTGWAIALCGALLLAATFAKLAVHWPCTGGPYAYVRRSFGDVAGFGIAWSYWISIWSGMAAIAVAFAGSIGAIFPALDRDTGACGGLRAGGAVDLHRGQPGRAAPGRAAAGAGDRAEIAAACCCSASSRCGSSMPATTCRSIPAARPCRRSPTPP